MLIQSSPFSPDDSEPMRGQTRRTLSRFTLIELLIAICIIAILAAMLLPALSASKDFAMRTSCSTRIRSVAQVWGLYDGDYNGRLPTYNMLNRAGTAWLVENGYYISWNWSMRDYLKLPAGAIMHGGTGTGGKPLNYTEMLHCPSHTRLNKATTIQFCLSYGMNGYGAGGGGAHESWRRYRFYKDIRYPSQQVIFTESSDYRYESQSKLKDGNTTIGGYGWNAPDPSGLAYRHQKGTSLNMAFTDGHMESRTRTTIFAGFNKSVPTQITFNNP